MYKHILTPAQLKAKLVNYNFVFTNDEFERISKLGFFHVFNSFVDKNIRTNGHTKQLSDYLKLYDLDKELRASLFPMIVELEGAFKQKLNAVIIERITLNSSNNPTHNEVVKYCIRRKDNLNAKKLFFGSTNKSNRIIDHYFLNHNDIPIWAYLELFTLNDFLNFLEMTIDNRYCLSEGIAGDGIKEAFTKKCGYIDHSGNMFRFDSGATVITHTLRLIKQIRNNIAHNQPIFDNRFLQSRNLEFLKISSAKKEIATKMNPSSHFSKDFDYKNITDSIVLIYVTYAWMLGKDDLSNNLINLLDSAVVRNNKGINPIIMSKYFAHDYIAKINFLKSI